MYPIFGKVLWKFYHLVIHVMWQKYVQKAQILEKILVFCGKKVSFMWTEKKQCVCITVDMGLNTQHP